MNILILLGGLILLLIILGIVIYPAFKVMPYVYAVTRLRSSRSRFMKRSELVTLAHLGYKDAILRIDEKKHLHLSNLIDSDFREEYVQRKLRESYLDELERLIMYTPKEYKLFFKLLRSRESVEFILTAIRSKVNPHYDRHIVDDLFVNKIVDKELKLKTVKKMSLQDFLSALQNTAYAPTISKYTKQISQGDLEEFERAMLTKYYFKLKAAAKDNVYLLGFVKRLIDLHNVRQAAYFANGSSIYIEGGSFNQDLLDALVKVKSVSELKTNLEKTYIYKYIANYKTITGIVQGLWQSFYAYGDELVLKDALNINQMISYYIHSFIETKNMRILLKLVHARFDPNRIERLLI